MRSAESGDLARRGGKLTTDLPSVGAVIVTQDTRALVLDCLASLAEQGCTEIVVVDNASCDGTPEAIDARWPDVTVVALNTPAGFARACNIGVAQITADAVLFLNSDTKSKPGAVNRLASALFDDPGAVATGGRLVDPGSDRTQEQYRPREFPSPLTLSVQLVGLAKLWPSNPVTAKHLGVNLDNERIVSVDQPAGACLLVRRRALAEIGGLDEGYWFWYEDVDLSRRLRQLGSILYVPDAVFEHVGGASFARWSRADLLRSRHHGLTRYAGRHFTRWQRVALSAVLGPVLAVRALTAPGGEERRAALAALRLTGRMLAYSPAVASPPSTSRTTRVRALASKARGRRVLLLKDARDHYVHEAPSPQVAVDLFRGEWTSRLPASLSVSGDGSVPLFEDERLAWGLERLGGAEGLDILELGPLEGGHTAMLHHAGAASILAVEGNSRAYLRCLVIKDLLALDRARFLCGEFAEHMRQRPECHDLCLAMGVLYHQRDPVALLELTALRARRLLLWTHYHDPSQLAGNARLRRRTQGSQVATTAGFDHTLHKHSYGYSQRVASFCGGMHASANWLTREDLLGALAHVGWVDVEIGSERPDHPNGPALTLVARRRD